MSQTTRTEAAASITLDQLFRTLCHADRRRILGDLVERDPHGGDEFGSEDFAIRDEERDALEPDLYHRHLPHLDDAGFIDWNRETDAIAPGPHFDQIRPLVELMDDNQDELPDDWP